jgi:uncharacterized membrane protein YphA (DoxX/SURF4 family)
VSGAAVAPAQSRLVADRVLPWIGTAARVFLGYTFVTAGYDKLGHAAATYNAVHAYEILPWRWEHAYASVLPALEMIVGIALIVGVFTRIAGVVAALGLCSFLVGMSSAWQRGLSINCGCFGGGGASTDPHYLEHILRDSGYLVCAVIVILLHRTALAVDDVLHQRPLL